MLRGRVTEALVPAGALAVGVVEALSVRPDRWWWAVALEAAAAGLLVGRRRWPMATCVPAAVVLLWMPWAGPALDEVAAPILLLAVLCYALARWVRDLRGLAGLALVLLLFFLDYLLVDERSHGLGDVIFVLALVLPPYVFGRVVRTLDEQRHQLATQQEQLARHAVRAERDRIARELHDVVAHSVSAMVVQTSAAQDLLGVDPERAARLLDSVAETGRRALAETGHLLHLVRDEDDELGLRPAPGLVDIPALVEETRDGGLAVDAALDLPRDPLPGSVDVSAYRVVQEALTNARRYADGAVSLSVRAEGGVLRIRCTNPVRGRTTAGSGLGLQGMGERVSLLGGSLRHGQVDGRFEVEVAIPVGRP